MSLTMPPPKAALPPGPRAPAWWQLVRFSGNPLGLLDECHRLYGDAFTLHVAGNGRFVMLSDPDAVREVFRADPDVLHSGEANSLVTATSAGTRSWCSTALRTPGSAASWSPP